MILELANRGAGVAPGGTPAVEDSLTDGTSVQVGDATVELHGDRVEVRVPPMSTTQLFHRWDGASLRLGTDLRELGDRGSQVDPRAVYALLQFGAVPPPYSPFRDVGQCVAGHDTTFDLGTRRVVGRPVAPGTVAVDLGLTVDEQADRVGARLDDVLRRLAPDRRPVILFSGGVDSGLLAARAAALGWSDTVLVNYAFGPRDAEAELAEAMAAHLGLRLERIEALPEHASGLAEMFGSLPVPFVDVSIGPTSSLATAVVGRDDDRTVVLDGTGADGGFALFGRQHSVERLYRLPSPVRRIVGELYRLHQWRRDDKVEWNLRVLRRSSQMDPAAMSIALNPLDGIAYHVDRSAVRDVQRALDEWMDTTLVDDDEVRVAGLDLALICADIYAQKGKRIYDASARDLRFPFLDPAMTTLALGEARHWAGREEPKWVLKHLLARHVPREMVYRAKSGFVAPYDEQFAHPEVVAALRGAGRSGPLAGVVSTKFCQRLADDLAARRPVNHQTHNFAWAVVTVELWWRHALATG